jgi:PAS domain S-box-containing protein
MELFPGGGEMQARCREHDWAATSLGPVEHWPDALRTIVRTVLDSPFPINLWCGPDLVLIYNDAYAHVLGAKHPGALGRPGYEVWSEIWPEIGPYFDRIGAGGPAVYGDDAAFVVRRAGDDDTVPVGADRPNAWFTFSLSPVRDERGDIVAFLNVVSETTGRVLAERAREAALAAAERAEARLRDVFAQAPAFMAVLRGDDHVFEYVNDAYYLLVGQRPLVGRTVNDALPEMRDQGFEQLLDAVLQTGEPYIGREVAIHVRRAPDSEPEERFVDFVYYPITEADGARTGIVAHGYDVTQHVLARRAAQRARDEAEIANRAKSQFVANMSHEIRTPINAVIGYTDLLDAGISGSLTPPQHDYVRRIRAASRHLLGLVNEVLDLARIESGEMTVVQQATSTIDVIASALDIVTPEAELRNVRVVLDCEKPEGILFMGDSDRVRQIVLNLLSNALKFSDRDTSVRVGCRAVESAGPPAAAAAGAEPAASAASAAAASASAGSEPAASAAAASAGSEPAASAAADIGPHATRRWAVIDVEDSGTGIAGPEQERVFDAFVQLDSGYTRQTPGTGLGLTISRHLARLMGGDITLRSSPGEGSCFSLWLRAAD